jgi:homoserine O-acetyltransferase
MSAAAGRFVIPNFELQCGTVLPEAAIVYQTYGELAPKRDNVILKVLNAIAHSNL